VPSADPGWRFGVMAATVALFALVAADPVAATSTAVLAWLVTNGFLIDRFGELSWHGPADIDRAAMLTVAAALGLLVAAVRRRRRG
jgi:hypothetical protein